jgi:hypothetical protein
MPRLYSQAVPIFERGMNIKTYSTLVGEVAPAHPIMIIANVAAETVNLVM